MNSIADDEETKTAEPVDGAAGDWRRRLARAVLPHVARQMKHRGPAAHHVVLPDQRVS